MGIPRLVLKADKVTYLQTLRQYFVQIRAAHRDRAFDSPEIRLPWFAVLTRMMVVNFVRYCPRFVEVEASRRVTWYALKLRRHKLAKGAYPEALSEIVVPEAGVSNAPLDPFTGKDLVYRKDGDGFVLYSVGKDLTDNGGRSEHDTDGQKAEDIIASLSQ